MDDEQAVEQANFKMGLEMLNRICVVIADQPLQRWREYLKSSYVPPTATAGQAKAFRRNRKTMARMIELCLPIQRFVEDIKAEDGGRE